MNYIQHVKKELSQYIHVEPELLDLYALLVCVRGVYVTWEDVHDAWSIWRTNTRPEHKSIIPFDDLAEDVQKMDAEYAEAIKATARMVNPRNITF